MPTLLGQTVSHQNIPGHLGGGGGHNAADSEAHAALDQRAQEPGIHRKYSAYYAYEFFVVRRN